MNAPNQDKTHKTGYRYGYIIGRLIRHPFLFPIGVLISIPILPILAAIGIITFVFNLYAHRVFQNQFNDNNKFIYFGYSESHQYDHFFGKSGTLKQISQAVGFDNWRETWENYQKGDRSIQRGSPFEILSLNRWRISNMRNHLPFFVIFTKRYKPKVFKVSEAYRKRVRDKGAEIKDIPKPCMLYIKTTAMWMQFM